jgi:hypothetical protein
MIEAVVRTRVINKSECIEVNECGPRNIEQRGMKKMHQSFCKEHLIQQDECKGHLRGMADQYSMPLILYVPVSI